MGKFEEVTTKFGDIQYMRADQAEVLRSLIQQEDAKEILEVGFFKGKSSAYIAAILEDRGAGRLVTIDMANAAQRKPNIHQLLEKSGLTHRVEARFAFRSYTWELQKLISTEPRPQFDLCYFDGGHHWDGTGFGVVLVDMLLKPGGLLLLDDMDWSVRKSQHYSRNPDLAAKYSEDEAAAPTVRRTWDLILPHLGYEHVREIPELGWAIARKRAGTKTPRLPVPGRPAEGVAAEPQAQISAPQVISSPTNQPEAKKSGYSAGSYWRKRSDMIYYQYFRFMVRCLGAEAKSMIDVGSGNAPYLEWFDWIPERVSIDLQSPYTSENVRGVEGNIFNFSVDQPFDICSCMQVLEHVPEPEPFAHRLLELGRIVLISVPYRWPAGSNRHHVHDPVDLASVVRWFGRKPNYDLTVKEPFSGKMGARLFAIFDPADPERRFGTDIRKNRRPA